MIKKKSKKKKHARKKTKMMIKIVKIILIKIRRMIKMTIVYLNNNQSYVSLVEQVLERVRFVIALQVLIQEQTRKYSFLKLVILLLPKLLNKLKIWTGGMEREK